VVPRSLATWTLLGAAAVLPFHELTARVGPVGLRPFETLLAVALLLALPSVPTWRTPGPIDREVAAAVLLGGLMLILFRGPGASVGELRLVILEPAFFYLLLTRLRVDGRHLAAALVLGAVAASLVGFGQVATGSGIEAEGVERIRGAYRSP